MYWVVEINIDGAPSQVKLFNTPEEARKFAAAIAKENEADPEEIVRDILNAALDVVHCSIHGVYFSLSRYNASGVWLGCSPIPDA